MADYSGTVKLTDGTNGVTATAAGQLNVISPAQVISTGDYVRVTDGTTLVSVTGLNALRVAVGLISNVTTLNAVTANTTGTTVAAGSAYSNWSAIAVATGSPTAGTLTLELSQDQTNWVSSGSTTSVTAAGNYLIVSTGKPSRYARVSLTGLSGTITLTVTMIAAG